MSKKMTIAALTAIAALSLGTAYAGGDKTDKSSTGAAATGATSGTATGAAGTDSMASKKTWTKEEAMKGGLTEEQFKAADVNADGKLDADELKAANIQAKTR